MDAAASCPAFSNKGASHAGAEQKEVCAGTLQAEANRAIQQVFATPGEGKVEWEGDKNRTFDRGMNEGRAGVRREREMCEEDNIHQSMEAACIAYSGKC